jgi:hypothetical protein
VQKPESAQGVSSSLAGGLGYVKKWRV